MFKKLINLVLLFPLCAFGQTDEINISAAFSNFIDLRISGNASIKWNVQTIDDYQNGFLIMQANSMVAFEVASSTNFSIQMAMTPMTDGQGNELDIRNLTTRLVVPTVRKAEEGSRWNFGTHDLGGITEMGVNYTSGVFICSTSPKTILVSAGSGNAGDYSANQFRIAVGLGSINWSSQIPIPSLLDQNITPGTYSGTLTLTALPEAI